MKNFPHIYYTNVDRKVDRKLYMESQFKNWGLKYTRIEMKSFPKDNSLPKKYVDNLIGNYQPNTSHYINVYGSDLIDFFYNWINSTKDEYLILMEDDYDLSLIKYWNFTWENLLERLPYDWDCVQLGFECPDKISFYLHPTKSEYSLGASLLKREYIEKLLTLHYPNKKYKFDYNIANSIYIDRESGIHDGMSYACTSGSPDYYINQSGKSYSIPLIPINPYLPGLSHEGPLGKFSWHPKISFVKCYEAYYEWWKNDRNNFSLDELFTYGKNNDILMERDISKWDNKYFYDLAMEKYEGVLIPTSTRDYN
jgi:hypothetical protein